MYLIFRNHLPLPRLDHCSLEQFVAWWVYNTTYSNIGSTTLIWSWNCALSGAVQYAVWKNLGIHGYILIYIRFLLASYSYTYTRNFAMWGNPFRWGKGNCNTWFTAFKHCVICVILQARILALNASYFLKNGGHFVISIKVLCSYTTRSWFFLMLILYHLF